MSRDQKGAFTEVVDLLGQLVQIPSINPRDRPDSELGEGQLAKFVHAWLLDRSVDARLVGATPRRPNVLAKVDGQSPAVLLLEAHLDTVEVDGMTIAPFQPTIQDGRLYGRGSLDTKATLAVFMHTLARLAATPKEERPFPTVILAATIDEEHTFKGVREVLAELQSQGATTFGAISGEPTDLRLGVAHKGVLRLVLDIQGKAGHSSRPEAAVSALGLAAKLIQAIDAPTSGPSHPLLGRQTRVVTRLEGGVGANTVPGSAELEVDIRILPGQEHDQVLSDLEAELDGICPGAVAVHSKLVGDWGLDIAPDNPFVQVVSQALEHSNLDGVPIGMPFGTDASKIAMSGVAAVVLGPGSIDDAHTADESVPLDQVAAFAEVIWRVINDPSLPDIEPQAISVPSVLAPD